MKSLAAVVASGCAGWTLMVLCAAGPAGSQENQPGDKPPATQPAMLKIDMDSAVSLGLPNVTQDLKPLEYRAKDGRSGWIVRMPGGRPIATPAYDSGMIFVGGGYGSHEFYAFDADSGKTIWQIKTTDDGPTAAVVEDGYVAFNTESCTVIVVEAKTGKVVWQEWLGDPLMSQPAIANGRLYISYPGGHPRGLQAQATQPATPANETGKGVGPATGAGHRLLCADLKTGRHLWEQDITSDVISAPVVEGDRIYLTCFDGTSFALACNDGSIIWKKQNSGTSAPLVAAGQVVLTARQQVGQNIQEGVQRLDLKAGDAQEKSLLAAGKAEYLKAGRQGAVALSPTSQAALDSSVGFAAAPASANLAAAADNVNIKSVAGGWAYQGSRAAYSQGQILNTQANLFNCVRASDGTVAWQAQAVGKGIDGLVQAFSPPAIAGGKLYVCSARGEILSMDQKDGKLAFLYSTGLPVVFQPALAHGNIYIGTANGALICLKTGDASVDGWTAWGGNAQHNKKD